MSTLSPNVPQLEQSLTSLAGFITSVNPYVQAMVGLPLGTQTGSIDGGGEFTYDPLANFPMLESQLKAAQQHCLTLAFQTVQSLHVWKISQLPDFNETFQSQSQVILQVLSQIPAGTAPSQAQRATVNASLQTITDGLNTLQPALNASFNDLVSDHSVLTSGSSTLDQYIPQIENQIAQDEIPYALGIGGAAIINIISEIGSQMIQALQSLDAQLKALTIDSAAAIQAMSGVVDAAAAASTKIQSISTDIQDAQDDQFVADLQKLDIQAAQLDWQNFVNFTDTLDL
jgi:hypothetical protein